MRAPLGNATVAWQSRNAAANALQWFEAQPATDFSDCLVAALAQAHGCESTATLDRGMRDLPGVRVMS